MRIEIPILISRMPSLGKTFFRLGERGGIYIKYSQNRMSPWSFTFSVDQKKRLMELSNECANVVIALVCEKNGIVGLSLGDVWAVIGDPNANGEQAAISVARRPNQQYSVNGSLSKLGRKVADNELENWVVGSLGDL
jgi:hypothetical protein